MKSRPHRVVLASLVVPLALAAPSLANAEPRGGKGTPATPPWLEQGESPLQRRIKESLESRRHAGHQAPRVEYSIQPLEDLTNVKTSRQAIQDPNAPVPRGQRRAVRAITRLDYSGPEEAGLPHWPAMKVKRRGNPDDELDFSAQYYDFLARHFPPDEKRGWPGFWQKYKPGQEPRTYTLTETIVYTTPDEPEEAGLQASGFSTMAATPQEPVLMGFTYLGPNIDHTIEGELEVCVPFLGCAMVYEYKAGFDLDWDLGLRLPAEARADGPSTDPIVAGSYYSPSSRLGGVDWSGGDYSGWGVEPEDGNEFVLSFKFFVGVKAKLFTVDLCPGCYAEVNKNFSTSFVTPLGAGATIDLPGFEIPIKEWNLSLLSFGLGVDFTPKLTQQGVTAHWEGVAGTAATGSGTLTYGEPGEDTSFGPVKACLVGSSHEARVRLSDFRYRLRQFRIDVGAYVYLKIDGYGPWRSDWTLASVTLATFGGDGLGRHQQCDVLFNCSPVGPPNVVDISVRVVDLEAPRTSMALAGTAGTEGWYRSNVVATLSAADNPPGCGIGVRYTEYGIGGSRDTYSGPFTLATEGVTTVTYRSVDDDGNTEAQHQQIVRLDKTPPVVSGAPTTEANGYGWYKTNVAVHFEASDAVSGVAFVTPDQTLSGEGASRSVTGHATDHAGNSASATVTGINIDKTAPEVTISSPQSRGYAPGERLTITWTASDSLSGIATQQGKLDGRTVVNGSAVDLLQLGSGSHTLVVTAVDKADNTGRAQVTFTLGMDIDGLIAATQQVCEQGWIDSTGVCNSLMAKLLAAKDSIKRGAIVAASNQLNAFLNELDAQKGKAVSIVAYDLLRAGATFVRDHLG